MQFKNRFVRTVKEAKAEFRQDWAYIVLAMLAAATAMSVCLEAIFTMAWWTAILTAVGAVPFGAIILAFLWEFWIPANDEG